MFVNHLGLALKKEDLEDVVNLMEPYGQINNGTEMLRPIVDVRFYNFFFFMIFKLIMIALRALYRSIAIFVVFRCKLWTGWLMLFVACTI